MFNSKNMAFFHFQFFIKLLRFYEENVFAMFSKKIGISL